MKTKKNMSGSWVAFFGISIFLEIGSARAAMEEEIFTGTITGVEIPETGETTIDANGLFGPRGGNLLGDAYTATYIFDSTLGTLQSGITTTEYGPTTYTQVLGGPSYQPSSTISAVSPVLSATITINGYSYSLGGVAYAGEVSTFTNGSDESGAYTSYETNGGSGFLFNEIVGNTLAIPASLTTPFFFSGANGYGEQGQFGPLGDGNLDVALSTNSVEIGPVPLPADAWLLLSGLGGFGAVVFKRRVV